MNVILFIGKIANFDIYLDMLNQVCKRFTWVIQACCLMTNHYHFLIGTQDGNLSKGMRQLNLRIHRNLIQELKTQTSWTLIPS